MEMRPATRRVVIPPLEELDPASQEWVERVAASDPPLSDERLRELERLLWADDGGGG
jgi:hypothetical protein